MMLAKLSARKRRHRFTESRARLLRLLLPVGVWAATLGTACPATARGDDSVVESLERRYQKLMAEGDLGAVDLFRISAWCRQISDGLTAGDRLRFRRRAATCRERAEASARREVNALFARAAEKVSGAATYAEASEHVAAAERAYGAYVDSLSPLFAERADPYGEPQIGDLLRPQQEAGAKRLEAALEPLRQRDRLQRIAAGEFFAGSSWHAAGVADEAAGYLGFRPLSTLVAAPREALGRWVATELVTDGRPFGLLGLTLFHGHDERGAYVPPHFMSERLVIGLDTETLGRRGWAETLARRVQPKAAPAASPGGLRFLLLARIEARALQGTTFFLACIEQAAVYDTAGELLAVLDSG